MARSLFWLATVVALLGLSVTPAQAAAGVSVTVTNGDAAGHQVSRFDVAGNALDAHDGSLLRVGDLFYLYGTSYACGYRYQVNDQFCGFKAYSSPDLLHWTDRGYIVAPGACGYCFRPHVVYNAATARYVLWADGGGRYLVYTSPGPVGLFSPQPTPNLAVGGAVDESLFVDDDGAGYLVHNTTIVGAGLTADMVVERLTPDYLTTNGQYTRLGLGDVEAFAVFKRSGVYHALMSDPSCAYCSGGTGEMTATSMLGPWSGAGYDPNGVHQSGRAEPRWRARIVNADNCGGQPLATFPIVRADGTTGYYFMSDRWNNRAPNESLADFYIGPMTFDAAGTLQNIPCVNNFTLSLPGSAGSYPSPPDRDQSSGFDGFQHYCDVAGAVTRQQSFTPSRSGFLSAASVTTFQRDGAVAPLLLDVLDGATGAVLSSNAFPPAATPWAPTALTVRPDVAVAAGRQYLLRLRSTTTTGCYGFEYNDANPYPGGSESYSVDSGTSFTAEASRDLKFTADVSPDPVLAPAGLPAGFTRCAGESETCAFTGTRTIAYGAGFYRYRTATGGSPCTIAAFGGDPTVGVLKSCYVAPSGGPAGSTPCAAEGARCAFTGPAMVAYGANGAFAYHLRRDGTACDNTSFGGDPLPGVAKACYLPPAGGPPAGWTPCASEGATCVVPGTQPIAYGAAGAFVTTRGSGPVSCATATFGADPIAGVAKSCYRQAGAPTGFATRCAAEGGTCAFGGFRTVAYGAAGAFAYGSFTNGVPCGTSAFATDPIVGVAKECYLTP